MNNSLSSSINSEQGFLFNVDIMIHSRTNALALQTLLEILNDQDKISDFRIQSGIELGTLIKEALHQSLSADKNMARAVVKQSDAVQIPSIQRSSYSNSSNSPVRGQTSPSDPQQPVPAFTCPSDEWIDSAMQAGRLIRIDIRDKKGIQKSIPCRILNYDHGSKLVSVYHVDEKQVYSIRTSEIEKYV